jgi:adenylylsulfate kinase-like enzyme
MGQRPAIARMTGQSGAGQSTISAPFRLSAHASGKPA